MKWIKVGPRHYCFGIETYTDRFGTTVIIGFGLGILQLYDSGRAIIYDAVIDGMDLDFWPRKNTTYGDCNFQYHKEWHFRKVPFKYTYQNRKFYGV